MKLSRRLLVALLVLSPLALPVPLPAQGQPEAPVAAPAQEGAVPSYPGIAEVIPRLSRLSEDAGSAQARVADIREQRTFAAALLQARERQTALNQRLEQLGDPAGWSVDRLLDIRGALAEQRNNLKKLLDSISQLITELDRMRTVWEQNKSFWQAWGKELRSQGLTLPTDAFARARETVDAVLSHVAQVFTALVEQQSEVTSLQEQNLKELNRIDASLDTLRRNTFNKTGPSFFNPAFYHQFNEELWARVGQGVGDIRRHSVEYFRDQGWLLLVQGGLTLILGWFIRSQRQNPEVAAEWRFILKHPWATGIFVSVSGLSFLYPAPPVLWRLLLWVLVVGSASLLIAGLLENRRKIFVVFYLAGLFLVSLVLQTVTLPLPLYRLYLSLATLCSIPLLLVVAKRNQHAKGGKSDLFVVALKGGGLVLFSAFAAQVGGYAVLASRLFEASLETVFLWLMTAMAMRLARGGVEFLFSRRLLQKSRFIRRAGNDLAARLKGVFDVFVVGYAIFYLLVVWGLFDSVSQAWGRLLELGFPWGETFISVQMILFAALVIYLSIVISWVLRAVLEWEVFPRKGMDRGVRDAIKKLLHYTLIFLGFLLAISLAGIDLKNFAVLAGALGIGIGFGLQNIVNNFVSGIILLFERPIKVGDMVVIEGEWGTVRKIGLRSTVVETIDQSEIIVPNSDLVAQKVTNWTLSTKVARVTLPVGVAYGSDLAKVLEVLLEAAGKPEEVLADPAPSAIFTGFGNSSLDFELRVWISDIARRQVVRSELGQHVDQRFRETGVEIPFPQRDLHLRSLAPSVLETLGAPPAGRQNEPRGKGGGRDEDA
jgi:potassium-dependent mechanosensitive channel